MKDKLSIISESLNNDIITELEARKQLLILLGVVRQSEQVYCSKCNQESPYDDSDACEWENCDNYVGQ